VEKIYYVDDKSLSGKSIGRRRLQLKLSGHKLARLSAAIMTLRDLIHLSKNSYWFVDSNGIEFQYHKTTRAKLICAKLDNILPIENNTGAILSVEGIPSRFKVLYRPQDDEKYAGILVYGGGYLLYGLYKEPFKQTWRKI
jgi:hypothetical protein